MTGKAIIVAAPRASAIGVAPGHPALSMPGGVMETLHRPAKGGDGDDGDS